MTTDAHPEFELTAYGDHLYVKMLTKAGSISTLLDVLKALNAHPDFPSSHDIWDFRDSWKNQNDIDLSGIMNLVNYIEETYQPANIEMKTAMLVDTDLKFGLGRMYQTISTKTPARDLKIFTELDEALEWLKQ